MGSNRIITAPLLCVPRYAHFYWAGDQLSYLRYTTLLSFRHHHPDWKIFLWTTDKWYSQEWAFEKQDFNRKVRLSDEDNFLQQAIELVDEVVQYNDHPDLNPAWQSDFMQWDALHKYGGFYLDMDQTILEPFDDLMVPPDVYTQYTGNPGSLFSTFMYTTYDGEYYYAPIGLIAAAPGCPAVAFIKELIYKFLDSKYYAATGPNMMADAVRKLSENHILKACNAFDAGRRLFYSIGFSKQVPELYDGTHVPEPGTKAIHWFGGHPETQKFNATYTKNSPYESADTISREVRKILTPSAPHEQLLQAKRAYFGREYKRSETKTFVEYYGAMYLRPDGYIHGYTHPNEHYWTQSKHELTLYDERYQPTTILKNGSSKYGMSGECLLDPQVTHILSFVEPMKYPTIVLSSAEKYASIRNNVIDGIIESARRSGADIDKVRDSIITVSAYTDPHMVMSAKKEGSVIKSSHTAYEWGALWAAMKCLPDMDDNSYVFMLHDTMDIGPEFYSRMCSVPYKGSPDIVAGVLVWDKTKNRMCVWNNVGMYRMKFLRRAKNYLEALHGKSREYCVELEHDLNKKVPSLANLAFSVTTYPGHGQWYDEGPYDYHGAKRSRRYFSALDITKYFTHYKEPKTGLIL